MSIEPNRTSLQGLSHVVKFNWHFFLISTIAFITLAILSYFLSAPFSYLCILAALAGAAVTLISLLVTAYIYDLSDLYHMGWIEELPAGKTIVNLSAGFDETSPLLKQAFPDHKLIIYDFYESLGEKEISIQRARRAYPPTKDTVEISLDALPCASNQASAVFSIFATHEIRDQHAREDFFKELYRITTNDAHIYIVEHLRDTPNFLAYTIGFLHFLSHQTWLDTIHASGWKLNKEIKHTPFISIFKLEK